jgi:serine protease inhibitor
MSLVKPIRAAGVRLAFTNFADFAGISSGGHLKISDVLQKVFVKVDQEGTEAAAVTAVHAVTVSAVFMPTEVHTFYADHPFLYVIRERLTDAILFVGHVVDPSAAPR